MRVYCRFIWNYENYHLSLYRVFHGIRLLRLRRLVVVRQSIFFMYGAQNEAYKMS